MREGGGGAGEQQVEGRVAPVVLHAESALSFVKLCELDNVTFGAGTLLLVAGVSTLSDQHRAGPSTTQTLSFALVADQSSRGHCACRGRVSARAANTGNLMPRNACMRTHLAIHIRPGLEQQIEQPGAHILGRVDEQSRLHGDVMQRVHACGAARAAVELTADHKHAHRSQHVVGRHACRWQQGVAQHLRHLHVSCTTARQSPG